MWIFLFFTALFSDLCVYACVAAEPNGKQQTYQAY